MHSNGVNGHSDDPASVPLPPALTQQLPRGDDGGSLPLEPFRFLRGLPEHLVDVPTEEPQASPQPEPLFELTLVSELEEVPPTAEQPAASEPFVEEAVAEVKELIQQEPELHELAGPTRDLAERFEKLSRRLRAEDVESLLPSLAQGDRFDTLVAGFLAGYFSAKNA